ncbi:hypothetical protein V3C99_013401 [Haemonchus contortus]
MNEKQPKSRRKRLKPVPIRVLQCVGAEESITSTGMTEQLKNLQLEVNETRSGSEPTLESPVESKVVLISDVSAITSTTSPVTMKEASPRSAVTKKGNIGNEENHCSPGTTSSRKKSKKRLPLSDATRSRAAKRNRLSGAVSQIRPQLKKVPAKGDDRPTHIKIEPSMPSEKSTQKRRRLKKGTSVVTESKKVLNGEEQSAVPPIEMDSRRGRLMEVINEVLGILEYPKQEKLCQALGDVLIDGVPMAVSAARQGFPEFYLRTFIQAILIHIRQISPELLSPSEEAF